MSWMSKASERGREAVGVETSAEAAAADAFDDLVEAGRVALQIKTAAHTALWGLGREAAWDVDQAEGVIRFELDDGSTAQAAVQILGTYDPASRTFLWAWDHPDVLPPLAEAARRLRAWGAALGVSVLTARKVRLGSEEAAWTFVAAALALTGAEGGYRGATDDAVVFMTFDAVSLAKARVR